MKKTEPKMQGYGNTSSEDLKNSRHNLQVLANDGRVFRLMAGICGQCFE